MKRCSPVVLAPLVCLAVVIVMSGDARSASAAAPPPNIILVIADDVSWNDIGAYGHPTIRTPVLDGLVARGIRFDNEMTTFSGRRQSKRREFSVRLTGS